MNRRLLILLVVMVLVAFGAWRYLNPSTCAVYGSIERINERYSRDDDPVPMTDAAEELADKLDAQARRLERTSTDDDVIEWVASIREDAELLRTDETGGELVEHPYGMPNHDADIEC